MRRFSFEAMRCKPNKPEPVSGTYNLRHVNDDSMATKNKSAKQDCKSCGTCDSYHQVNPDDDAGYCHLMPPIWIEAMEEWTHPVVEPSESCRFWLRKLNS